MNNCNISRKNCFSVITLTTHRAPCGVFLVKFIWGPLLLFSLHSTARVREFFSKTSQCKWQDSIKFHIKGWNPNWRQCQQESKELVACDKGFLFFPSSPFFCFPVLGCSHVIQMCQNLLFCTKPKWQIVNDKN